MLKKLKRRIQNIIIGDGLDRSRPRWLLSGIGVLAVILMSASAFIYTQAAVKTYSIWSNNDTPKVIRQDDPLSVELGLKFQTKEAGQVTGVKFYKSEQNVGVHTGTLWTKRGKKLATVTFKNETKFGWQSATFDKPVTIKPDVTYIVSYFAPKGNFSIDARYFAQKAHTNGPLTAIKSGTDGANGVYSYGYKSSFPSDDSNKDNYKRAKL